MKKIALMCLLMMVSTVMFQNSLLVVDAIELDGDGPFGYPDLGGNTTQVSVLTATPEVMTVNATAITRTIVATTASVSISSTEGTRNYYFEAAMVIVIAAILGIIAFARKKRLTEH